MFYVLGDIHGYLDKFDRGLSLIEADGGKDASLYFVGDFVDRGPDSKAVIQKIMDGQAANRPWQAILGNHDQMFVEFVETGRNRFDPELRSDLSWTNSRLGGMTTLHSYMSDIAIDHPDWISWDHVMEHGLGNEASDELLAAVANAARAGAVDQAHLDWLNNLPLYIEGPDNHLFVHAGIRPGVALADQTRDDLVWIRDGWLDYEGPLDQMVVHGHTALDFPIHYGNRINLDAGAGRGRTLVPAVYDDGKWFTLDEAGRTPLTP
ncbi:metallophosphoesterase [Octadecabacter sp.]|nr:metallophosphoesterase [Octadecabacter sp.]